MKRRPDPTNVRQTIAVSLAIVTSLVLLLVPMYTEARLTTGGIEQIRYLTLLETVGPSAFVPLLIPVALTVLPLLLRGHARIYVSVVTTAALTVFIFIGSASIGYFYVPALTAAVAALVASTSRRGRLQARPS